MVLSALLHFIMTNKCVSAHSSSTADILVPVPNTDPVLPHLHITCREVQSERVHMDKSQQDLDAQHGTFPTQGLVSGLLYIRAASHTSPEGFKAIEPQPR